MTIETNVLTNVSPDLQAEVVEMLPVFIRTLNLIKLLGDTMSEETVAHTMIKLENASSLLEIAADERLPKLLAVLIDKSDLLLSVLDKVAVLEKNGTLDRLLELSQALGVATEALTEHSIKHLTETALPLLEIGDQLLSSSLIKSTPKLLNAVEKTSRDMAGANMQPLSVFGLLGLLKKKEVQEALHFGVQLLGNLSKEEAK